jgi:predicted RNA binding protein YcfA (HicA-like mRNA interferase family)
MTKLPLITSREMEKLLLHLGFKRKRQAGSHVFYKHSDGRITTIVPFHPGEDLGRGLIRKILRDIKVDQEEYLQLRQKII